MAVDVWFSSGFAVQRYRHTKRWYQSSWIELEEVRVFVVRVDFNVFYFRSVTNGDDQSSLGTLTIIYGFDFEGDPCSLHKGTKPGLLVCWQVL